MKGTAGEGKTISDCAIVAVGLSERGIAIQSAVFMPGANEFDGATIYLDILEAQELARKLDAAISTMMKQAIGSIQTILDKEPDHVA